MERKHTLSVIVITKNEADRIGTCLESVSTLADEIIVLDSGSEDDTVAIARRYTDQVYETDWPGYGPQKQRALEKARGDWVLSIDADEAVSVELAAEIAALLARDAEEVAFRTPWAVHLYGRRLDHGRSGRAPKRLFRREGARFSDAQVHESVLLPPGPVGQTRGRLIHYTHRDFKHALDKFSQYAWLWANERFARGKRAGLLQALAHSAWMFLHIYFLRLGLLDGRRGLLMAVLYGQYTFNKYAALWTLRAQRAHDPGSPPAQQAIAHRATRR